MKYNIAVVGATGLVGSTMLKVLAERKTEKLGEVFLFASERSEGKKIEFCGQELTVIKLSPENIKKYPVHIALFACGGENSKTYAPLFVDTGAVVIDNSSAYRQDPAVPLVVPEVNPQDVLWHKGIIANPNCSTIQAVAALAPLHNKFKIKRIIYSTYQAVSGAGVEGLNDLRRGKDGESPQKFPYPIFGNVLPHIDSFTESGYTKEELKMIFETKKILGDQTLKITATTVRVPVENSHSESVNVEFYNPITLDGVRKTLSEAKGINLMDDPKNLLYPMPLTATGSDEVFVGRLRIDDTVPHGLNMWIVSDNVRKGAATNAVQIAELLMK